MLEVLDVFSAILVCLTLLAAFIPKSIVKLLNKIHIGVRLKEKLENVKDREFIRAVAICLLSTQILQWVINFNISKEINIISGIVFAVVYIKLLWVMGKKKEDFFSLAIIIAVVLFAIFIGFLRIWNSGVWMFLLSNITIMSVSLIFMVRGIQFYKEDYLKVLGIIAICFLICKTFLEFSYIFSDANIREIVSCKNILDGFIQVIIVGGAITYISIKRDTP